MLVSAGLLMSGGRPSADAAPPNTPANTVAPAITGTATVGQTLTVSNGTWTNSPTGYARQWTRDVADIAGATGATYALVEGDSGKMIGARVTATNADGSGSATAAAVGPVAAAPSGGQQLFTSSGTFVVPAGVTSICGVAISRGGYGSQDSFSRGGGGGSLAYRNAIAVTSGETVTIVTGAVWGIMRGGTYLLGVQQTEATTPPDFPIIVGTGFRGGNGGFGGLDEMEPMSGGGAGGYTSAGGGGASYYLRGGGGSSPYGGGAGAPGNGSPDGSGQNYGGGGGLSAGGLTYSPGAGCVRIIWGAGRLFPNTNTGDV